MKKTLFVQPRHVYAPSPTEGEGHIYSPTSLWTIGSKLIQAGADIDFIDENLHTADTSKADVVGVNLVGAPYISLVRERFRDVIESDQELLLGGQVITGLTRDQISKLFGNDAIGGNLIEAARATGAKYEDLVTDEKTSLVPAYEKISDDDMKEYLDPDREVSFYLAQGCVFDCAFCPAQKNTEEKYRDMEVIERDLTYLTERALKLDIHQLNMYLSSLDVFQNPESLGEFASVMSSLQQKYEGFTYRIRGLATVATFRNAVRDHPKIVQAIRDAGFHTVGFGIDGGDPEVWRSVKKGHNNEHTILEAMEGCNDFDIVPETIMVFGHPKETRETLESAVHLTEQLQDKFGAVPRPHIAKDLVPGNDYWRNEIEDATEAERTDRAKRIQLLLEHPEYFQALDFKALASSVSHPDEVLRHMVNEYYRTITNMSGNSKELIYPIAPEFSDEINALHRLWNKGRFDR